jgi:hypothetical protein
MAEPAPKRMRLHSLKDPTTGEEQYLTRKYKEIVSASIRAIIGREPGCNDFKAIFRAAYNLTLIGQAEWICQETEKIVVERVWAIRDSLHQVLVLGASTNKSESFVEDLLAAAGGFSTGLKMVGDCFAQIDRYACVVKKMLHFDASIFTVAWQSLHYVVAVLHYLVAVLHYSVSVSALYRSSLCTISWQSLHYTVSASAL